MTVTPPPSGDYPGPLRSFLVAVAKDGDVLDKWWEQGPDPSKGKYGHLWDAMSPAQQNVLLNGTLKEINAAIEDEARAYPKPGEEVDSAHGLAWALVRI